IPARVRGRRPTGGRLELLFVRPCEPVAGESEWEGLVRGSPCTGEGGHLPDADGQGTAPLGDGGWRPRVGTAEPGPPRRGPGGEGAGGGGRAACGHTFAGRRAPGRPIASATRRCTRGCRGRSPPPPPACI